MKKILYIMLIGLFVMSETAWGIKLSQLDKDLMSICDTNKLDKIKKYTPQDIAKSLNSGLFSRAISKDAIITIKYFLEILNTISFDKEPTALAAAIKEPLEAFQKKHSKDGELEAKIKAFLEKFAPKTEQPTTDLNSAFTTYSKTQSAENAKTLIELIKKEDNLKKLQDLLTGIDTVFAKLPGEEDSKDTKQIKAVLASAIKKLGGKVPEEKAPEEKKEKTTEIKDLKDLVQAIIEGNEKLIQDSNEKIKSFELSLFTQALQKAFQNEDFNKLDKAIQQKIKSITINILQEMRKSIPKTKNPIDKLKEALTDYWSNPSKENNTKIITLITEVKALKTQAAQTSLTDVLNEITEEKVTTTATILFTDPYAGTDQKAVDQFKSKTTQIKQALQNAIEELRKDLQKENPEIAKLKTELGQLKGSLSSLQKKLNALNAKLNKLQTKLA